MNKDDQVPDFSWYPVVYFEPSTVPAHCRKWSGENVFGDNVARYVRADIVNTLISTLRATKAVMPDSTWGQYTEEVADWAEEKIDGSEK